MVDPYERLNILLKQEVNTYGTNDYLTRMKREASSLVPNHPNDMEVDSMEPLQGHPCKKRRSGDTLSSSSGSSRGTSSSSNSVRGFGSNNDNNSRDGNLVPILVIPKRSSEENPQQANEGSDISSNSSSSGDSSPSFNSNQSTVINRHWREKMCEWAYQVVDHFDLQREVVAVTMNHIDRYLATCPAIHDRQAFQLLAMTCLNLAIKIFEYKYLLIPGSNSTMETILKLSRGTFALEQMERMEVDVLVRLKWFVHPPTPQVFVKHILYLFSWEQEIHDMSQFMVELSVIDYFFVKFKPSDVSVAAMLNAYDMASRFAPSEDRQQLYDSRLTALQGIFDMTSPDVLACRERLSMIYQRATQAPETAGQSSQPEVLREPSRTTSPVSVSQFHPTETRAPSGMHGTWKARAGANHTA